VERGGSVTYTKSPQQYAEQAAEAVRALNHVTLGPNAYEWPADVDRVIAELHLTAMRMEQALTQAGRWLTAAESGGQVGHDQGHDTTATIAAVTQRLEQAGTASRCLAEDLNAVRQITAHLTGTA
jgi:hypothetical protein